MMQGAWLDLTFVVLLVGVLALLYRLQTARSTPLLEPATGRREPAGFLQRAAGYYPRLARQSGYDPDALRWVYWLGKIALAALLPLLAIELLARRQIGLPPVMVVLLVGLGFFAPDLALVVARKRRQRRIRNALSYFLDLVVSLVQSGLGLEDAFRRAAREGIEPGHPLAHEAGLVDLELGAGKDRSEAFQSLAERTGVTEFRGVAAALKLGLRLGNPVEETLSVQADILRTKRREEARRALSMAPLKTLVPMLLCGFPVFLVLVIFPALIEIGTLFAQLREVFSRL